MIVEKFVEFISLSNMNCIQRIFPNDVVRLIYEMNAEHRDAMLPIRKNIFIRYNKADIEITGILYRILDFEMTGDYRLANINYHFPDADHVIRTLKKCKCCERHQKKKPKSLKDPDGYNMRCCPVEIYQTHNCTCYCRSFSRMIYRKLNK